MNYLKEEEKNGWNKFCEDLNEEKNQICICL